MYVARLTNSRRLLWPDTTGVSVEYRSENVYTGTSTKSLNSVASLATSLSGSSSLDLDLFSFFRRLAARLFGLLLGTGASLSITVVERQSRKISKLSSSSKTIIRRTPLNFQHRMSMKRSLCSNLSPMLREPSHKLESRTRFRCAEKGSLPRVDLLPREDYYTNSSHIASNCQGTAD